MSKIAKQLLVILGIVLLLLLGYTGFLTFQNQNLEKLKLGVDKELEEAVTRERGLIIDSKKLKDQIQTIEAVKLKLEKNLEKFKDIDVDQYAQQIDELKKERDDLQNKVAMHKKEAEELLAKLAKKPEPEVVYKYVDAHGNEIDPADIGQGYLDTDVQSNSLKSDVLQGVNDNDETYWAQVLKEKTALELEVDQMRSEFSGMKMEVTELKKTNSDLQLEMAKLTNQKEEIERQIKHGKDLSDSLSLELARAQNDKKFLNDRLIKINDENTSLQEQIKQLMSTKIALEKGIVRLQDEKRGMEKKLYETENVIQGRIDEIWDIKKDLEQNFGPEAKTNSQVELPPIVVSASNMDGEEDPNMLEAPGINGNVVSVNNENNFVIIDIGEDQGIHSGDSLNIYRGAEYVAGVEIIQIRQDIAAADIISKVADIKVGDAVR